ncbi:MAG: hypothetical protein FJZ90_17635, partial [Chloroflexi bacterium]|nr:hypothetical protein [Chloroflexota bacterium]
VARGLLEVRVGVMRQGGGIAHAKFGVVADAQGERLVFRGSGNETGRAILENYEEIELSTSWDDPDADAYYRERFRALWEGEDPYVAIYSLPEAVRQRLIQFAPSAPPVEIPCDVDALRCAMLWRYIAAAPYLPHGEAACDATAFVEPWPHQRRVVEDTAHAFPAGRLLCDEVGLGKTIEAILILRRLLCGRGVRRALLLVPAGLLQQWQEELREKGGLLVPYWDGRQLRYADGSRQTIEAPDALAREDVLLLSREWARLSGNRNLVLTAPTWDLMLLDEAHAARRSAGVEREFNSANLLLQLLRELQLRRRARGILLLSATPMQIHPWEPWDLLTTLGVGGRWMADFSDIRAFYDGVAALRSRGLSLTAARPIAHLVAGDEEFPPNPSIRNNSPDEIARGLAFCGFGEPRRACADWLRQGAPLGRRMHRNTRDTLRQYHRLGLLDQAPPRRELEDVVYDYGVQAERDCYEAITGYIDRRYEELEQERGGKGFVMTVYRRRAASSPHALRCSLARRLEKLERVIRRQAVDPWSVVEEEQLDERDLADADLEAIDPAVPSDPEVAARERQELRHLLQRLSDLGSTDSKLERFSGVLRQALDDGRAALVFSEYTDTMDYLRDQLRPSFGKTLGCYSGDGGQMWDGQQWVHVGKAE